MSALASVSLLQGEFAQDVLRGLTGPGQKTLPSRWLYDDLGSTLFEAITLLPEYGLTRADGRLLRDHSPAIARAIPGDITVIELGSGTGTKTRWILEAFAERRPVDYYPIDISPIALAACRAVLEQIDGVRIVELHASYLDGLVQAAARRAPHQKFLVLFLGSTIGNFDYRASREFLAAVRARLQPGDALLLGADLIKPLPQMLLAYDDPIGVTAAFNLNVLSRINHELDADFNLRHFEHHARFNQNESRIEMHIRARSPQSVNIRSIDRGIRFRAGETIWTEGSYKFRPEELLEMASVAGFEARAQWIDHEWPFSETLMFVR